MKKSLVSYLVKIRIKRFLNNRVLNGKILTTAPKEGDNPHWDWYQREIVFLGKPFRYKIGFFEYRIEQVSKFGLLEIENELIRGDIHDFIFKKSVPNNKFAQFVQSFQKTIFLKHTPAEFLTGVISEYIVFCSSCKKKMWDINPKGIIQRDTNQPLTRSRKESILQNTRILKRIGMDIFGIR